MSALGIVPRWLWVLLIVIVLLFVIGFIAHKFGGVHLDFAYLHFRLGLAHVTQLPAPRH